ncbi:hypothetical protein O0I10_003587 [Lichtheimia ornata]|uniref:Uncharacterized protein n=1 Tax=Lichtheimia ornata TaxID=688661 RepID=A0AAD7V8T6_9FUNG|nr:uncharacterized protein O0I10_003587 [Lichtheimia ornata]KAJ8660541.1 hypothetical protein O0I10_003587 [Lichtheimia ornata]
METTELYRILNMTRDTAVAGVAAAATWKPEKLTQMLRHNMYWNMEIIHFVSRIKGFLCTCSKRMRCMHTAACPMHGVLPP